MWIQTGVTVRKRLSWVVTSVTLTFDLWPWPFAWTSLLTMVITPENFMMIRWWEHGEKGVTDRRTDGQTDRRTAGRTENTICRAAWSQLKTSSLWKLARFSVKWSPGGWFNIKMPSYQNRKSHCGDKTILRPSYLHNGISYTGKMTSLY